MAICFLDSVFNNAFFSFDSFKLPCVLSISLVLVGIFSFKSSIFVVKSLSFGVKVFNSFTAFLLFSTSFFVYIIFADFAADVAALLADFAANVAALLADFAANVAASLAFLK